MQWFFSPKWLKLWAQLVTIIPGPFRSNWTLQVACIELDDLFINRNGPQRQSATATAANLFRRSYVLTLEQCIYSSRLSLLLCSQSHIECRGQQWKRNFLWSRNHLRSWASSLWSERLTYSLLFMDNFLHLIQKGFLKAHARKSFINFIVFCL